MQNEKDNEWERLPCVPLVCNDEDGKQYYGTGTCFRTADPHYDLVLTAGHCISDLRPESISLEDKDLIVEAIFRPDTYKEASVWDFTVIVIRKMPPAHPAFTLPTEFTETEMAEYSIIGYPEKKRGTEKIWNVVSATVFSGNDDGKLIFRLTDAGNSADYSEKELLEGMSGGPVVLKRGSGTLLVRGVFTHMLNPDGAYHEACCIDMKQIMDWMRRIDLIYIQKEESDAVRIFEAAVTGKPGPVNETEGISAILIGKSGAGKSAFAKTFMKNASMFETTGQTRTTRSTIKYNIGLYCKKPYIRIRFFNKEEFIAFRLKRCYEILNASYADNMVADDMSVDNMAMNKSDNQSLHTFSSYSLEASELSECAFANDSFFDYRELSYLDSTIRDKIQEAFKTIFGICESGKLPQAFPRERYLEIQKKIRLIGGQGIQDDGDGNPKNEYTLDDMVSLMFEMIYDLTFPAIRQAYDVPKNKKNEITLVEWKEPEKRNLVNYSLKVHEGKSLTGFVKEVTISDRVCDEYVGCFMDNDLSQLAFLDTYGLDHMAQVTADSLKQRLWELSSENADVNFIFYIRKLGTDAPSDLESFIPAIYAANPHFRVYAIFTGIDENQMLKNKKGEIIQLLELNKTQCIPAVKYFVERDNGLARTPHPIYAALLKSGVSKALSENIHQCMRDNLVAYCASEEIDVRNNYLINNIFHVGKLIHSLVNKDFLGDGFIDIIHVERCFKAAAQPSAVKSKLMELLKKMFVEASIKWYGGTYGTGNWRTQQANISRLQNGRLGYSGTHNHEWNAAFFSSYNKVFSKLSEDDFNLLFSTGEGLNDAIAIQQLMNGFGKVFLRCHKYKGLLTFPADDVYCSDCTIDNCFRHILLGAYTKDELKLPVSGSRPMWLNDRCDFGIRFEKIQARIYDLFIREFRDALIPEAKAHNARKAANSLSINPEVLDYLKKIKDAVDILLNQYENPLNSKRIAEILGEVKYEAPYNL